MEAGDLKPHTVIAGSGKMARNIGLLFLRHGYAVTWTSRDVDACNEAFTAHMRRDLRRLARSIPEIDTTPPALRSPRDPTIPPAQIVVESTVESLAAKHAMLGQLNPLISEDTLLLSNSSSLLPASIHPRCVGFHFFYPIQLSGVVELITPPSVRAVDMQKIQQLLTQMGLHAIRQTETSAFAINRLLLSVQAECFRMLTLGRDAATIDEASASCLLPMGQLSLIDSVGIDTIHASVINYVDRMSGDEAPAFLPLVSGLEVLLGCGKRGKKSHNGLLSGEPLPWNVSHAGSDGALATKLLYLFMNRCYHFLGSSQITASELDVVLQSVFHAECSLEDVLNREGRNQVVDALAQWHAESGVSYFQPARALLE